MELSPETKTMDERKVEQPEQDEQHDAPAEPEKGDREITSYRFRLTWLARLFSTAYRC